mgnify:CR=1 FL=1
MNSFKKIGILIGLMFAFIACQDNSTPNYQYMPNMYEPVSYETYEKVDFLPSESEAMTPPANTINRGWLPYGIANTPEGKELARLNTSPLDSMSRDDNFIKGKEMYDIYCATCHGKKGDGNGFLSQREKFNGIPNYKDRDINAGSIYHVIMHGKNLMGSHASQITYTERWQIVQYVEKLRSEL